MKSSEALREAARRIESGESDNGVCVTIEEITNDLRLKKRVKERLWKLAPANAHIGLHWFGKACYQDMKADQSIRILAACFAAAIAESEGD